jgi:hypothetical protein
LTRIAHVCVKSGQRICSSRPNVFPKPGGADGRTGCTSSVRVVKVGITVMKSEGAGCAMQMGTNRRLAGNKACSAASRKSARGSFIVFNVGLSGIRLYRIRAEWSIGGREAVKISITPPAVRLLFPIALAFTGSFFTLHQRSFARVRRINVGVRFIRGLRGHYFFYNKKLN